MMDFEAYKAWISQRTREALEGFRQNNAYRERPGRDLTHVRLGIGPEGKTFRAHSK